MIRGRGVSTISENSNLSVGSGSDVISLLGTKELFLRASVKSKDIRKPSKNALKSERCASAEILCHPREADARRGIVRGIVADIYRGIFFGYGG
jgi:hypothetical protein